VSRRQRIAHTLQSQAERLITYCAAKGYQAHQVVKEIG
jgi:hypothetical protein